MEDCAVVHDPGAEESVNDHLVGEHQVRTDGVVRELAVKGEGHLATFSLDIIALGPVEFELLAPLEVPQLLDVVGPELFDLVAAVETDRQQNTASEGPLPL